MASIDWKKLRDDQDPFATFDAMPGVTDWSDPTHVPLMVADVVAACGNVASEICECPTREGCGTDWCPLAELHLAALDAMPGGRSEVEAAVTAKLYTIAIVGGWSEYLYERGTKWYGEGESDG